MSGLGDRGHDQVQLLGGEEHGLAAGLPRGELHALGDVGVHQPAGGGIGECGGEQGVHVLLRLRGHGHGVDPLVDVRAGERVHRDGAEGGGDVAGGDPAVLLPGAGRDAGGALDVLGNDGGHGRCGGAHLGGRLGREREGLAVGVEEVGEGLRVGAGGQGAGGLLAGVGVAPQDRPGGGAVLAGALSDAGHALNRRVCVNEKGPGVNTGAFILPLTRGLSVREGGLEPPPSNTRTSTSS